jgi:hypothetical protein
MDEQIGKHSYKLKFPLTLRLYPVFHINNLRSCSKISLRPTVPVTVQEGDYEEFDVSHIFVVSLNFVTMTSRQILALHDAL